MDKEITPIERDRGAIEVSDFRFFGKNLSKIVALFMIDKN